MSLTIDLGPELESQLRAEAAQGGQAPEEFVRTLLEERLASTRARQIERNQAAIALLREWQAQPVDPKEVEGYPEFITPLSLREAPFE
jgi:plasmid stability protein